MIFVISAMSSVETDIIEENKRQKVFFHPCGVPQAQKLEKWNFKVLTPQKEAAKCPD
jgi:hypothetical protein